MITEEALQFIETTLESETEKQLTPSEKEILKAAWDSETYSSVTEIILWQSLCKAAQK